MKHITGRIPSSLLMIIVVLTVCRPAASALTRHAGSSTRSASDGTVPAGCTVFSISKGDEVFFAGNDDYVNPDSYYWVDPGNAQNHGAIWVGWPDNVQQGVNDQGLAYDANGLPRVDVNPHSERIPVSGSYSSYPLHILHECATVEEVITWVNTHQWHSYMHDQMHFADATGDAVIISAGADGEVAFTRKPPGDGFLISTNFNVADPINASGYPCWRYDRAQELLGRLVDKGSELTAEDAAGVLNAVHQHGAGGWTIASIVADLPRGLIYLYYFYQFDRPIVLSVEEELANPRVPGPLSHLFPDDVRQEAARRYQEMQAKAGRCRLVGMAWLAIALISLILMIALPIEGRRGLRLWVPAAVLLGPLALLVRFIAKRCGQRSRRPIALLEALGDVTPTVIAFVASLVTVILVRTEQAPRSLEIPLVLGLPLLTGWLAFHGPLLASLTDKGYWRFLSQRLPHVLVATNLGMGGISVVAMPLVNQTLRTCSILPLTAWTVMIWWAISALGALVGGLLLFLYECWALRGGFQAWSIQACGAGTMRTPSWRKLWWWIPLSFVALFGGIAIGVILQQVLAI
jgi:hypothetical protein